MTAEETRRVYDKIDKLAESVAALHGDVKAIRASCEPCKRQVDRLVVTVYGADNEGLATKVGRVNWLANGIAAMIGGGIVAAAAAMF